MKVDVIKHDRIKHDFIEREEHDINRSGIYRARLADGRWHFQHGLIDLIITLDGPPDVSQRGIDAAWRSFQGVLLELCAELTLLRADGIPASRFVSPIAQRMADACWPFHERFGLFVTPMAAVAGSVAEEILKHLVLPGIKRASVNNGGDIALYVAADQHFDIGVVSEFKTHGPAALPALAATVRIDHDSGVRGIATSGWRGRSLSMGIADAVTVLARTAAAADSAATLIANAVNVEHPGIVRLPADQVRDDSDLQSRLVTCSVCALPGASIDAALDKGAAFAERALDAGLIESAFLVLQGSTRAVRAH